MNKLLVAIIALALIAVAYAQVNPFENKGAGATVPAIHVMDVTPNNNCNDQFAQPNRGIWVGASGNLRVQTYGGETLTIVGIQSGTLLPLVVKCIYSTSTTATSIQIWW